MYLANLQNSGCYLLSCLIFLPALGALALLFVPSEKVNLGRKLSVGFSLATLALTFFLIRGFEHASPEMQFVEIHSWLPAFGINFTLGVDGISLWFLPLTALLMTLVLVASTSVTKRSNAYCACMLLLEAGIMGTFLALDAIAFYVFWELMLVPMYFLIGIWGGARKVYAAIKFVLFTAFGSLLMLVAIIYLAYLHQKQFGSLSFFLGDWTNLHFGLKEEILLFSAFALAFAIKVPVFPFHTWLPDAHVEAPTGGSVILAGVLLKMGLYGLIRFCLPIFPDASMLAAPIFATLGVVGIIFGALVAWMQTDIKKLVAYSSVSHLGFCVLGYASLNLIGMQGCILQMLNHGVSTAALFFLVGVLYDRKHTRLIVDYSGLASKVPLFSLVFLIFTLSSIGLPLTNGFVGEFLILLGGFQYSKLAGVFAVSGVVLGAIYMLSLYRRTIFGELNEKNADLEDLTVREKLVFAPLIALVFFMGVLPQVLLASIEPSSERVLAQLGKQPVQVDKHIVERRK